MYQVTEEEVRLNLEDTDKIVVANNAITYGNTIYQIRNITSVTVRKWKYIKTEKMPGYILIAWFAIGGFLFATANALIIKALAVVIIVFGWLIYLDSKVPRVQYAYSLMIELSSGAEKYFFQNASKQNLEEVVRKLQEFIERPYSTSAFIVYNSQVTNNITIDNSIDNSSVDNSNRSVNAGYIEKSALSTGDDSWIGQAQ